MKEITICNKKHKIACNGLTYIHYKKIFNIGIFEDINIIKNYLLLQVVEQNKLKKLQPDLKNEEIVNIITKLMQSKEVANFIEAITRIAYIMIYTADNTIESYEEWLKSIEKINLDDNWIVEVAEFAVDCFC